MADTNFNPLSVIAPGASSALSFIGGLMQNNYQSQAMQDQMNFAAHEAELNRQFQKEMWSMNNQYNTPAAQRSRLEQAGLNPYLMFQQGSTGVASTAPSGSQASSGVMPQTVNPLQGSSDALLQFAAIDKTLQESKRQKIENGFLGAKLAQEIVNMKKQGSLTDALKHGKDLENDILPFDRMLKQIDVYVNGGSADSRIEDSLLEPQMKKAQIALLLQQGATEAYNTQVAKVEALNAPKRVKAQISAFLAAAYRDMQAGNQAKAQAAFITHEDKWYNGPKGIHAHEVNQQFWSTQNLKKQMRLIPDDYKNYTYYLLESMRLGNEKTQMEIDKMPHDIVQGYLRSISEMHPVGKGGVRSNYKGTKSRYNYSSSSYDYNPSSSSQWRY